MAIFPCKYQRPRIRRVGVFGRPGFVAPKQQLQHTRDSILSIGDTAADSSTAALHTTHADRWSADLVSFCAGEGGRRRRRLRAKLPVVFEAKAMRAMKARVQAIKGMSPQFHSR